MGFTVLDSVLFSNGLTLSNFIVSINGYFTLSKKPVVTRLDPQLPPTIETKYQVTVGINYYINSTQYAASSPFFRDNLVSHLFTLEEISGTDIYTVVYTWLKSKYTNTTDLI